MMVEMYTRYAIRRKGTSFCLPVLPKGHRHGHTHSEPRDPRIWTPRLFNTEDEARRSLVWWCQGPTIKEWIDGYSDGWNPPEQEERLKTTPAPGRKIENMEIIPVTLTIGAYE